MLYYESLQLEPGPLAAKKAAQHSGVMVSLKFLAELHRKPWPMGLRR